MNLLARRFLGLWRDTKGQSAIEFAAIIPTLFIFFFGVLEFSLLFVHDQRVSALSREVANSAFRDCGSLQGDALTACLSDVVSKLNDGAQTILPGFDSRGTLIASVFIPDPNSNVVPPPIILGGRESAGGSDASSYSAGDLDAQFVSDQGIVVIGEVFYQHIPLTPVQGLLNLLNFPQRLYETTIY